jgi:hypothetical protein
MTAEYEIIREGLIALLSVGDKINYLYDGIGFRDDETGKYIPEYRVMRCTITKIIGYGKIAILTTHGPNTIRYTKMIDVYKGELYLHDIGQPEDRDKRLARLTRMLEAKETVYE